MNVAPAIAAAMRRRNARLRPGRRGNTRIQGEFGRGDHMDGRQTPLLHHRAIQNGPRSEEHTSELQSPYVISYAVCCLKKKAMAGTPPPTEGPRRAPEALAPARRS